MSRIAGVYGILPPDLPLEVLLTKAEAAMQGGVLILQLRDKQTSPGNRLQRALSLREISRRHGCRLIVNDDADLALAAKADGLHVGPGDYTDLAALRARLGEGMLLGVSCKGDVAKAKQALAAGADYVSLGAIFATQSKKDATVIGLEPLRQARRRLPQANLVAIGGITAANIHMVKQTGADAAAVIAGLFDAADVKARARALVTAWKRG